MNIGNKTRVLVVDDSALVRSLIAEIVNREPDMTCIGAASDALVAREMIRSLNPDAITLDVEMPRMDGLEFLARLMRLRPMPVVMVSTLTERGAEATLQALELGAVDFVCKPKLGVADGLRALADDLTGKLRIAARANVRRAPAGAAAAWAPGPRPPVSRGVTPTGLLSIGKVIFIGASTGGTEATRAVLTPLPADAPPVLIAQHMPPGFTRSHAQRLDAQCRIHVKEAEDGERLRCGHAYLAPGGLHLSVERAGTSLIARVRDGAPVNQHKPSVEVLFRSAARVLGADALGVMLSGMGSDGAHAMREMRDAGAFNLVQDEGSCVVFGMPREAIAAGAVHEVLPLERIGPRLLERLHANAEQEVSST